MMVWSDMVEENLEADCERWKRNAAAAGDGEEEEEAAARSGRVKLKARRRGARRAAMDMGRTCEVGDGIRKKGSLNGDGDC